MNFNLLFDLDFYRKNQFEKNDLGKLIYSWKDLNSNNNYIGANFCERSQLEIWINGKRKKTLKLIDLFNDSLLFPLYSISETLIVLRKSTYVPHQAFENASVTKL